MAEPLISVIIPVYNVEKYLEKCINSVIGQTYKNIEIIIVDDGSTDKSGLICDFFAGKDTRIVVIHKVNGGLSSARNAGLDIAKGDYIGFVDSDDWIEPDMYECLLCNMLKENADKYCGKGLATVCKLVDIPPVIHLGSCVDCSRILQVVSDIANYLDMDISEIPVAGVAPEWMSEKAVAIGTYVVSSGIDTYLGIMPSIGGSQKAMEILTDTLRNKVGAKFTINEDPTELAKIIVSDIEKKRISFEEKIEERMGVLVEA